MSLHIVFLEASKSVSTKTLALQHYCRCQGIYAPEYSWGINCVNHAFARVTPAIFVIFVVSRGLSSKALVFYGLERKNSSFSPFSSKTPLFLAGQRHG